MVFESIRPDPTGHFLITESGKPFFWLADTAWELFHRLNLGEAEEYLDIRKQQGFNVILSAALAELDGLHTPNALGDLPLQGDDPNLPNEPYFSFMDEIIHLAASKGLYIGLLPTWGDKITKQWGIGPEIFDPATARNYGRFLGNRYRDEQNLLWVLGGDRQAEGLESVWNAMAAGITAGFGKRPFFTYHPREGKSSSEWFHKTEWLDMNMLQSGHRLLDTPNWQAIHTDYLLLPSKPVLDGEPNYEDHPIDPFDRVWLEEYRRFTDYDVRKQAYRSVFAGACGHTYGHHSVWQFWNTERTPVNFPAPDWQTALHRPGGEQMIHLKNLMMSRGDLNRIPDLSMLPDLIEINHADAGDYSNPARAAYPCATRDSTGRYAYVYFPLAAQTLSVDIRALIGKITAHWFDPRTGEFHPAGDYPNWIVEFTSPASGPDWVLVLDSHSL